MTHMPNLNRLGKWRALLAGWQVGSRPKGDPECDAIRDHREATLLLRAELTAVIHLLIERKVFTQKQFEAAVEREADFLCMQLESRFPGIRATDDGLSIDPVRATETMKGWKP